MKKKQYFYLILTLVLMISILSVFAIMARADSTTPEMDIEYCNLSFRDSVCIKYAVKSNVSDVKILIWTSPKTEYVVGTQDDEISTYYNEDIDGTPHIIFDYTKLTAKQMTDVVYARAYSQVDGEDYYSEVNKYSILQYAYNKLGKTASTSTDTELKEMLTNMLSYGASAQKYFDYKENRLASADWYQVKVTEGLLDDRCTYGLYLPGDKITLIAPEADENGKAFSHWVSSKGDQIANTATYELTVGNTNEVYTPVYGVSDALRLALSNDGTYYTVAGIGAYTDTNIIIPETYKGLPVKAIESSAFYKCTDITSIVIPNSVTSIGQSAFYDCSSLTSVTIPNNITRISVGAFAGCYALKDVYITDLSAWCKISFDMPSSTPMCYAENLYLNGTLVTEISTPSNLTDIRSYTFYGCSGITSITIPNGVTSIGQGAFQSCSGVTSIAFDGTITQWNSISKGYSWDDNAGSYTVYCTDGEIAKDGTITRKKSTGLSYDKHYNGYYIVTGIGDCTDTEIFIPSTYNGYPVQKIGDRAFQNQTTITYVDIPDSITTIGDSAFYGCTSLENVKIPNSVSTIGEWAFACCSAIETIDLPDDLTTISDFLFEKCTGLKTIIIPDKVTYIGYSFYNCTSLETVTLGKSVTDFYCWAFSNSGVSTLIIKGNVIPFAVMSDGVYVSYSDYIDNLKNVIIEGNVTAIREDEFKDCSLLERVVLPEGVLTIGSGAFYECSALKEINIPDSVTYIGSYAFYGCSSLQSITIPESVTTIDYYAFWDCTELTSVTFADPNGWWYSSNSYTGNGTNISSTSLSDPVIAATFITSSDNYAEYYWRKS